MVARVRVVAVGRRVGVRALVGVEAVGVGGRARVGRGVQVAVVVVVVVAELAAVAVLVVLVADRLGRARVVGGRRVVTVGRDRRVVVARGRAATLAARGAIGVGVAVVVPNGAADRVQVVRVAVAVVVVRGRAGLRARGADQPVRVVAVVAEAGPVEAVAIAIRVVVVVARAVGVDAVVPRIHRAGVRVACLVVAVVAVQPVLVAPRVGLVPVGVLVKVVVPGAVLVEPVVPGLVDARVHHLGRDPGEPVDRRPVPDVRRVVPAVALLVVRRVVLVPAGVPALQVAVQVLVGVVAIAVLVDPVVPNLGHIRVRVHQRVEVVALGVGLEPVAVLVEVVVARAVLVGAVVPFVVGGRVDVRRVERVALEGPRDRVAAVGLGAVVGDAVLVRDVVAVVPVHAVGGGPERGVVAILVLVEVRRAVAVRVDVVVPGVLGVRVHVRRRELGHPGRRGEVGRHVVRVVPAVGALDPVLVGVPSRRDPVAVLVEVRPAGAVGVHAVVPGLGGVREDVRAVLPVVAVALREGDAVAVAVDSRPLGRAAREHERSRDERGRGGGRKPGQERKRVETHSDIVPRIGVPGAGSNAYAGRSRVRRRTALARGWRAGDRGA